MTATLQPGELDALLHTQPARKVMLLDVRRRADYESDPGRIPGAEWRDPEQVAAWSAGLAPDRRLVVYCARGGSVSRSVAAALAEKGIAVEYLEGGIAAWKASGRTTVSQ